MLKSEKTRLCSLVFICKLLLATYLEIVKKYAMTLCLSKTGSICMPLSTFECSITSFHWMPSTSD